MMLIFDLVTLIVEFFNPYGLKPAPPLKREIIIVS